jgi:hypothetical protein
MISLDKKWNMIISEVIPGFVLSLDLLMLIDSLSCRAVRGIVYNSYLFVLILIASSIFLGFMLLNVSFFVFEPMACYLLGKIWKAKKLTDYWLITIRTSFFNMIIPLIALGYVFPEFIASPGLNPWFSYIMYFAAFISFVFGVLQEYIQNNYGSYYGGE